MDPQNYGLLGQEKCRSGLPFYRFHTGCSTSTLQDVLQPRRCDSLEMVCKAMPAERP